MCDRDEQSRHHYYLQLRCNVVERGLVHACASEEVLYLLAGLALQADFGDLTSLSDTGDNGVDTPPAYFKAAEYFPQQVRLTHNSTFETWDMCFG